MSISLQFSGYDIVVKHLHKIKSSKNWYYIRRIPKEFQHLYPDPKHHTIRFSTKTSNVKEATKVAINHNKELEQFWLNNSSSTLKNHDDLQKAISILDRYGLPPTRPPVRPSESFSEAFSIFTDDIESGISIEAQNRLHQAYIDSNVELETQLLNQHLPPEQRLALEIAQGKFKWTASLIFEEYFRLKGWVEDRKRLNDHRPALEVLLQHLGDRQPSEYTRLEIHEMTGRLLKQGLSTATVKKRLGSIRSAFNEVIRMHDLRDQKDHAFYKFEIKGYGLDKKEKPDFTQAQLESIRQRQDITKDDVSSLIAVMMETGLRVKEACGIRVKDIKGIDGDYPYLVLHRDILLPRKTKNSQRFIPLTGVALQAIKLRINNEDWLFSRYVDPANKNDPIKNDAASAAINKRLKIWLGERAPTAHSFRHTLATRLRDTLCPEAIMEEMAGWRSKTNSIYGSPTDIRIKMDYIEKSLDWDDSGWRRM